MSYSPLPRAFYACWRAAARPLLLALATYLALPAPRLLAAPRASEFVAVEVYRTNADRTELVSRRSEWLHVTHGSAAGLHGVPIAIDAQQPRQRIDGFGYALTQGSAELLMAMTSSARQQLLTEVFGTGKGQLGVSTLRLPIGATDLSRELYTFDDVPEGDSDPKLQHFTLTPDQAALLPICREILAIHPGIHLIASPWTAPLWMKESIPGERFFPLRNPSFYLALAEIVVPPAAIIAACVLLLQVATKRLRPSVALWWAAGIAVTLVLLTFPPSGIGNAFVHPLHRSGGHIVGEDVSLLEDGKVFSRGRWNPIYYPTYLRLLQKNELRFAARVHSDIRSMMTNGKSWRAGRLRPECYGVYARYFARYLQAMQEEGIPVEAVTVQNESEPNLNKPSMGWSAAEQNVFVRDFLGPVLRSTGLATHILIYDHNADDPEFPLRLLRDPRTNSFVDGSAFHLYVGRMEALSKVHDSFPMKNIYFTEQMVIEDTRDGVMWPAAEPVQRIFIGALRNWSRDVILWNIAADQNAEPHVVDGGCPTCLGAVTLQGDRVTRNLGYYVLAQVSPFVPEGSVVLTSTDTSPQQIGNIALATPDNRLVLILTNTGPTQSVEVTVGRTQFSSVLQSNSVATYVFGTVLLQDHDPVPSLIPVHRGSGLPRIP